MQTEMDADELEELVGEWAAWWLNFGRAGYTGGIMPPIQRTREAGVYPNLLARPPRRARRQVSISSGNLRLPLG